MKPYHGVLLSFLLFPLLSSAGIKLKVLIPSLEATKLMKFDTNTSIKDIKKAIILKHRFTEPPEFFQIYRKGDVNEDYLLDDDKTVADCNLKDMESVEMRRIGSQARRPSTVEGNPFAFSEALPPGLSEEQAESISQATPTVKDISNRSHRITSLWTPMDPSEEQKKLQETVIWKKLV